MITMITNALQNVSNTLFGQVKQARRRHKVKLLVKLLAESLWVGINLCRVAHVVLLAHSWHVPSSYARIRHILHESLHQCILEHCDWHLRDLLYFVGEAQVWHIFDDNVDAASGVLIEVDEHHGCWIGVQEQRRLEGVEDWRDCLSMSGVEDELRHGCRVSCHIKIVHEHLCILPCKFSL